MYSFKCKINQVEALADRRKIARQLFIFDLLSGKIEVIHILSVMFLFGTTFF